MYENCSTYEPRSGAQTAASVLREGGETLLMCRAFNPEFTMCLLCRIIITMYHSSSSRRPYCN